MGVVWLIIGIFFTFFKSYAHEDVGAIGPLTTQLSEAGLRTVEVRSALEFLNINDSAISTDKALRILRVQSNLSELLQQAAPFLKAASSSIDRVNVLEIITSISAVHRANFVSSMHFLSFMADKIQFVNTLFMVSRKDPEEWLSVAHYFRLCIQVEEGTICSSMQSIKGRDVYNIIEAIFNVRKNDRDGFLERMKCLVAETRTFESSQRQCSYIKMRSYFLETFCVLSKCSFGEIDDLLQVTRYFRQVCSVPHDCALLLQKLAPFSSDLRRKVLRLSDLLFRPKMTKSDQIWVITTLADLPVSDWERLVERAQHSGLWLFPVYSESPQGKEVFRSYSVGTVFYVEALVENLGQPL